VRVDSPGIERRKVGRSFSYVTPAGRRVRSAATLERIRAIAIPPAWTEVWICPDPNGHIQAMGRDAAGRRQYRYHAAFRQRRDTGKFDRLVEFGETLPRIRRRMRQDLARRGLPREKVLATVVALLELTSLRVGNPEYAALNRSFGLSTLRDRHARISGSTIHLRFRGKGGRTEERTVIDRRLATLVRRCQELPGQELFQYEDEAGHVAHRLRGRQRVHPRGGRQPGLQREGLPDLDSDCAGVSGPAGRSRRRRRVRIERAQARHRGVAADRRGAR
jgi:DNA topoisomerase-1